MNVGAAIKYTGPTPQIARRELNRIMRDAYTELAGWYHDTEFMKRFTYAGGKALNFQSRSVAYNKRKFRRNGNYDFLVWSGQSRALARIKDVRATATSARVVARLVIHARALNFRRSANAPDMADEVRRISKRECVILTAKLGEILQRRFAALNDTQTVKAA